MQCITELRSTSCTKRSLFKDSILGILTITSAVVSDVVIPPELLLERGHNLRAHEGRRLKKLLRITLPN